MSKYTSEQVIYAADLEQARYDGDLIISGYLRDYATLLRERESVKAAKAAITDEIVHAALTEYYGGEPHPNCTPSMRAALEAVAPMLASARVPNEMLVGLAKNSADGYYREGWNECRNAMLAAAPKPETEE